MKSSLVEDKPDEIIRPGKHVWTFQELRQERVVKIDEEGDTEMEDDQINSGSA